MPFTFTPKSRKTRYSIQTVLKGHLGPVICLSATDDGKLASGGVDGVRIWDFRMNGRQVSRPSGAGHRGATTALAWVRREDEPDDGLVFGTANGYLVSWKETRSRGQSGFEETYCAQVAMPSEITSIAFEPESNRLVTSNRNSVVQVFTAGSNVELYHIYSVVVDQHVPKAVAFSPGGGENKDILTFGIYDGKIHTLRGSDGTVHQTIDAGCVIGNVVVNARRNVFCLDDPDQGIALYKLDSGNRVRTYEVPVKKSMRPRQVAFAEDCSMIVSGSDHGMVYVFDRRTGEPVDMLETGTDRVQAIAVMSGGDRPRVFSAVTRASDEECDIIVWKKNEKSKQGRDDQASGETRSVLRVAVHLCMLIASVAFVFQNIGMNTIIVNTVAGYLAAPTEAALGAPIEATLGVPVERADTVAGTTMGVLVEGIVNTPFGPAPEE